MRRVVLAVVGSLVLVTGCTSGGDSDEGTTPVASGSPEVVETTTSTRPTSSRPRYTPPPPVHHPPTTSTPTPTGIATAQAGQTLGFGIAGDPVVDITLESVERYTETHVAYGDPPLNGNYVTVTLLVKADAAVIDPIGVATFDYYLRDAAGNRWDTSAGNGYREAGDQELPYADLNAGEQVRGTVTFDAGLGPLELVYAPESRAIGAWAIP